MSRTALARQARVLEHLLDHVGEAPSLGLDQIAVPPRLVALVDDTGGQILRRRSNHRQRRAQLVRDGGHEVHLLRRQFFGAARVEQDETGAGRQHAENAEAQPQVAMPDAVRPRHRASRRACCSSTRQPAIRQCARAPPCPRSSAECCSITIDMRSPGSASGLLITTDPEAAPARFRLKRDLRARNTRGPRHRRLQRLTREWCHHAAQRLEADAEEGRRGVGVRRFQRPGQTTRVTSGADPCCRRPRSGIDRHRPRGNAVLPSPAEQLMPDVRGRAPARRSCSRIPSRR